MKNKKPDEDRDLTVEAQSAGRTTKGGLSALSLAIILLASVSVIAIAAVVVTTHPDLLESSFGRR